jgi:hypothetical protein
MVVATAKAVDLLSARDRARLAGVHPDLVAVVEAARRQVPFIVVEGMRMRERQAQLVKSGATGRGLPATGTMTSLIGGDGAPGGGAGAGVDPPPHAASHRSETAIDRGAKRIRDLQGQAQVSRFEPWYSWFNV